MNKIILGGAIVIAVIIILFSVGKPGVGGLLGTGDFIAKYKSAPDAILLDVRTPDEFNSGHIKGAVNVDYENPNFEQEVKNLDSSKTYFVYCRSGNRSSKAIAVMKTNNIENIYELRGGVSSAPELLQ